MSNMTRGKIQRGNTVRVPMLSRGPLVRSNGETALQNLTNLRQGEAEDHSSQSKFFSAIFDVSPAISDVFFGYF